MSMSSKVEGSGPAGRGRGRAVPGQRSDDGAVGRELKTETNNNVGAASWGTGNFGTATALSIAQPEPETDSIDWDAIKENQEANEKARWAHLPEMYRNFYTEHPDVTSRSEEEVSLFRRDNNNIEVKNFNEVSSSFNSSEQRCDI